MREGRKGSCDHRNSGRRFGQELIGNDNFSK